MPQGAHWTPVSDALAHLRAKLHPVCGVEGIPLAQGTDRILAGPAIALRSHPPTTNAAVDGYAFKGPITDGPHQMALVDGRSAAGVPFGGTVPEGQAIRILTGADVPKGTDTIILQEDITTNGNAIAFHGPLKAGANARQAGEDMAKGQTIFKARHKLTPCDLATLASAGVGRLNVRKRLRVGILSTGDELLEPGRMARAGKIYDANRPMLCAAATRWGYDVRDLGIAPDNREDIKAILDQAAQDCDVILTSGGASAGDEDHISALLQNTGSLALWRIAIKPGRPLALGIWNKTPVFGLPGNPVAAAVCALLFARPALSALSGAGWVEPITYQMPAAFTKSKKGGRQEYLRARLTPNGQVETFGSEGSGRVSGLSWATGLVALPDAAMTIENGTPVSYMPFSEMGL
jgi:molybdopterin molybdotransferase